MRVTWHGHSCFEINDAITVVTDPHDGKSIGIRPPVVRADLVLISHDHFDHSCSRIVKGDFEVVSTPGEHEKKGIKIRGVATYHDKQKGAKRGDNIVFRFEMDGIIFCHCGDLGHLLTQEQVEMLKPIDVLFIPVGGVFTIDGKEAKEVVKQLEPSITIPMHYRMGGLSLSVQTIDPLLEGIPKESVFRVGNEVEIYPEELPRRNEYWVFSP